jgi:hypothetical protein
MRHQILDPGARCGSEVIAGVTQVMEVQAGSADRFNRTRPAGDPVEVATPKRRAFGACEH